MMHIEAWGVSSGVDGITGSGEYQVLAVLSEHVAELPPGNRFPFGNPSQTRLSVIEALCPNSTNMKRTNVIYWISTVLLTLNVAMAGVMYFANPGIAIAFGHLGFPDYFRQELGIAKLLAAVVIILPMVPLRMKEWAYVGLGIVFISAVIAHTSVDGFSTAIAPLISMVLLVVSYIFLHKRNATSALAAAAL